MFRPLYILTILLVAHLAPVSSLDQCVQGQNCKLPDCFCATLTHPTVSLLDIPQMVYFGFDDAVQPQVSGYYDELFTEDRKNPNGCPITMTLYVSDEYTQYSKVHDYYERGMEVASHSVTHTDIDTAAKLRKEAWAEKENLVTEGQVPQEDVVGWRSPNLKTAGDDQPPILASLGYTYDNSLSYSHDESVPWPFTLDYGYPYPCTIPPCPDPDTPHSGFWELMVRSFTDPATGLPCGYVDGCRPKDEDAALDYLWYNFQKTYSGQRAPFGLNMHAAWFAFPEYLAATKRFIDILLQLDDVYIINVKQMLDWMRTPVPLSQAKGFKPWGCSSTGASSSSSTSQQLKLPLIVGRPPAGSDNADRNQVREPPKPVSQPAAENRDTFFGSLLNLLKPAADHSTQGNRNNGVPMLPPITNRVTNPTVATYRPVQTVRNATQALKFPSLLGESAMNVNEADGACIQGVNCHLPACFCRTEAPPLNLRPYQIPQIVYIAIDSRIDGRTFAPLMQMFSGLRKNPNGCPISGTVFMPTTGNYPAYVEVLQAKGVQLGIKGGNFSPLLTSTGVGENVYNELRRARAGNLTRSSVGWRGFANLSPSDGVFQELHRNRVLFDSSVLSGSSDMPWPYTMDFGLRDRCSVMASHCPTKRYPGMWEIPMTPLRYTYHPQPCYFLDTCPGLQQAEDVVYRTLMDNFLLHYKGDRSPFGVNLRAEWLVGSNRSALQKGILKFVDEVLDKGDVTIASIEQVLSWIASPVSRAQNFPCK